MMTTTRMKLTYVTVRVYWSASSGSGSRPRRPARPSRNRKRDRSRRKPNSEWARRSSPRSSLRARDCVCASDAGRRSSGWSSWRQLPAALSFRASSRSRLSTLLWWSSGTGRVRRTRRIRLSFRWENFFWRRPFLLRLDLPVVAVVRPVVRVAVVAVGGVGNAEVGQSRVRCSPLVRRSGRSPKATAGQTTTKVVPAASCKLEESFRFVWKVSLFVVFKKMFLLIG